MHVVRQNHPCVDPEWPLGLGHPDRLSQCFHLLDKRSRPSVGEGNGKEDGSAWLAGANVAGHGASSPKPVKISQISPQGRTLDCG
jgi:hypothetical protein